MGLHLTTKGRCSNCFQPLPEGRKGYCLECTREYNREYSRRFTIAKRKWKQKNPNAVDASNAVYYAKVTGRIKPKPCAICNRLPTEGHHPDYRRPLKVIWLCRLHHLAWHKKLRRS